MSIKLSHLDLKKKKDLKSDQRVISDLFKRDIQLTRTRLSDKKKEAFYSELGILLSSGIDIKSAIDLIIHEQKTCFLKEHYQSIYDAIIGGASLSDALKRANYYTAYEINTINIGEESSRIIDVLNNLSDYYVKKIKQKRQLMNAFSYPLIVVLTAFGAIYFMLNYMVPMFQGVFERFDGSLPKLTQYIIYLSDFFSKYLIVLLLIFTLMVVLLYSSRKRLWFRKFGSKIMLSLPFIGSIVRYIYIERFFQAMALLTSAKIPLLKSLNLVSTMVEFYPFEIGLRKVEKEILYGKLLNECLSDFNFFDKKVTSLIKVGEETNQLDYIFEKLYSQYAEELEFKVGMISSLLEPVIIIFIGLLVGVILVSMYLPMFQMSTSIM